MDNLNIYQRLTNVKKALAGGIEKGGTGPQSSGNYKYVKWDDVSAKIGPLFAAHGIVPLPSITGHSIAEIGSTQKGSPIYRSIVNLTYRLVNADDKEDDITLTWVGESNDYGDKGVQQAASSGTKYLLMKLFLLAGAEDTEALETPVRAPQPKSAPAAQSTPAPYERAATPTTKSAQPTPEEDAATYMETGVDPAKIRAIGDKCQAILEDGTVCGAASNAWGKCKKPKLDNNGTRIGWYNHPMS